MFKEPMEINTVNASKLRQLQLRLESYFSKYYEKNDLAHSLEHARSVYKSARIIAASTMPGKLDVRILAVAAYAHDMFLHQGRDGHQNRAAMFILTDEFKKAGFLPNDEAYRLASAAAGEHRASYTGMYTSPYSEVISAADRGEMVLTTKISRMMLVNQERTDEQLLAVVTHIKEKYSRNGYARYPDCYIQYYGARLEKFYDEVESLNLAGLKQILDIEREWSVYNGSVGTTGDTVC